MKHPFALLAVVALAGAAAACSTRVDPPTVGPSTLKHATGSGSDDGDATSETTSAASSTSSSGAAGATSTTAAAAPPVDAFAGAPAFTTITPTVDSSQQHLGSSNAGKDCLACHGVPDDGAPTFSLAGTVRLAAAQPDGATGVQVRVVGPDGTEVALVGTDSVGNFWLLGATQVPAGSHVAIRNGTVEQKMSGTIANGSCNTASCHDPTRPIFIGSGT